jgi:hypothetical protein
VRDAIRLGILPKHAPNANGSSPHRGRPR